MWSFVGPFGDNSSQGFDPVIYNAPILVSFNPREYGFEPVISYLPILQ